MTNPYAPPQAGVDDIAESEAFAVPADRGTRLGAAILDSVLFMVAVYMPLMVTCSQARIETAPEDADRRSRASRVGAAVVALVGLVVWSWFTLKLMARNGQSIAKKWLGIKVVRTRRFTGVAGSHFLAAQHRQRPAGNHPAVRPHRRAADLQREPSVHPRQDRRHDRRRRLSDA